MFMYLCLWFVAQLFLYVLCQLFLLHFFVLISLCSFLCVCVRLANFEKIMAECYQNEKLTVTDEEVASMFYKLQSVPPRPSTVRDHDMLC
jgi:hypothetical protein